MKRAVVLALLLLLVLAASLAFMRNHSSPRVPAGLPAIVSFTANPQQIGRGESVTLDWETQGVDTVAVEWGPADSPRGRMERREGLPPMGTQTFQPQEDTIYVLECETGPVPACTESTSVRVR
jgi:hypothetical protein